MLMGGGGSICRHSVIYDRWKTENQHTEIQNTSGNAFYLQSTRFEDNNTEETKMLVRTDAWLQKCKDSNSN